MLFKPNQIVELTTFKKHLTELKMENCIADNNLRTLKLNPVYVKKLNAPNNYVLTLFIQAYIGIDKSFPQIILQLCTCDIQAYY